MCVCVCVCSLNVTIIVLLYVTAFNQDLVSTVIFACIAVFTIAFILICLGLFFCTQTRLLTICKDKCRSWIRHAPAADTTTFVISVETMMDNSASNAPPPCSQASAANPGNPEQSCPAPGLPPEPISDLPPHQSVVCLPQQPIYSPEAYRRAHLQQDSSV